MTKRKKRPQDGGSKIEEYDKQVNELQTVPKKLKQQQPQHHQSQQQSHTEEKAIQQPQNNLLKFSAIVVASTSEKCAICVGMFFQLSFIYIPMHFSQDTKYNSLSLAELKSLLGDESTYSQETKPIFNSVIGPKWKQYLSKIKLPPIIATLLPCIWDVYDSIVTILYTPHNFVHEPTSFLKLPPNIASPSIPINQFYECSTSVLSTSTFKGTLVVRIDKYTPPKKLTSPLEYIIWFIVDGRKMCHVSVFFDDQKHLFIDLWEFMCMFMLSDSDMNKDQLIQYWSSLQDTLHSIFRHSHNNQNLHDKDFPYKSLTREGLAAVYMWCYLNPTKYSQFLHLRPLFANLFEFINQDQQRNNNLFHTVEIPPIVLGGFAKATTAKLPSTLLLENKFNCFIDGPKVEKNSDSSVQVITPKGTFVLEIIEKHDCRWISLPHVIHFFCENKIKDEQSLLNDVIALLKNKQQEKKIYIDCNEEVYICQEGFDEIIPFLTEKNSAQAVLLLQSKLQLSTHLKTLTPPAVNLILYFECCKQ